MRHQDFSLLANAAEEVANVLEQLATQHPDVFKSLGIRHPLADELGGYAFMLRDHVLTGEAPSAPSEPIAVQSPSGMAAVFESLGIQNPLAYELTGEAPSAPSEPIAVQQADPAPGQPRVLITVRGGVADYVCDPGVDVAAFDFDNHENDPTGTSKLPAHFADLALSVGAAFEGDGHSEEEGSDLSAPAAPGGA